MRLLRLNASNELTITDDLVDKIPQYAILSHTWGQDADEVKFADLQHQHLARAKPGYAKIEFCALRAKKDDIEHFWIDTCCIDKANSTELAEAITSMFQWYRKAVKCYVYLSDVLSHKPNLSTSRWFTRGWTLQELLAPEVVEFYARDSTFLGTKITLVQTIHEITGVSTSALEGAPLSEFSVDERMRWAARRETKKKEDKAYCLFGIFGVFLPLIYGEGENAFHRLQEEIRQRYGTSERSIHTHWCVPRSRNPIFTGRKILLQELEIVIRHALNNQWAGTQCRMVISGMGGQGKSETCLQLAHRLRHLFWAVIWVDVSTPSVADNSFLDAARRLSIPSQTWEDARLGISNLKHPWLMVLDNADDDIDYLDYFPDGPLGVVLLTSRNEECHQYATTTPVALSGLEQEDALVLLLRASGTPRDQHDSLKVDAGVVARLLQSHALALIQAGAYIARGHCTFSQYPRAYEERRKQLLTFRPTQARSRYRDVYTTFEVSADVLKAMNTQTARDALQLLHLLAICAPSRLPQVLFKSAWEGTRKESPFKDDYFEDNSNILFTSWHVSHLPPFLDTSSTCWDPFRLMEAVSTLKSFSLISVTNYEGDSHISMHPLVHAWAGERQSEDEQHHSWLQIAYIVALAMFNLILSSVDRRLLQAHIEALVERVSNKLLVGGPPELIVRVFVRLGFGLLEASAFEKIDKLTKIIFEYLHLDNSQVEASWIGLYRLTAANLMARKKFQEGLQLYEQLTVIEKLTLAEDEPGRQNSQNLLAITYRQCGKVKESIALLEHLVKIGAEDDPGRLISQHELAVAYRLDGRVGAAITLLKHVVMIQDRTLAEDDTRRLRTQYELGVAYRLNGQTKEAMVLISSVAKIGDRIFNEDHRIRLTYESELAICHCLLGDHRSALSMMTQVVAISKRALAENDPDRACFEEWLHEIQRVSGRHTARS